MTIQHETWQVVNSVLLDLDMILFLRIFLHAFLFFMNGSAAFYTESAENHPGTSLRGAVSLRYLPYWSARCNAVDWINAD